MPFFRRSLSKAELAEQNKVAIEAKIKDETEKLWQLSGMNPTDFCASLGRMLLQIIQSGLDASKASALSLEKQAMNLNTCVDYLDENVGDQFDDIILRIGPEVRISNPAIFHVLINYLVIKQKNMLVNRLVKGGGMAASSEATAVLMPYTSPSAAKKESEQKEQSQDNFKRVLTATFRRLSDPLAFEAHDETRAAIYIAHFIYGCLDTSEKKATLDLIQKLHDSDGNTPLFKSVLERLRVLYIRPPDIATEFDMTVKSQTYQNLFETMSQSILGQSKLSRLLTSDVAPIVALGQEAKTAHRESTKDVAYKHETLCLFAIIGFERFKTIRDFSRAVLSFHIHNRQIMLVPLSYNDLRLAVYLLHQHVSSNLAQDKAYQRQLKTITAFCENCDNLLEESNVTFEASIKSVKSTCKKYQYEFDVSRDSVIGVTLRHSTAVLVGMGGGAIVQDMSTAQINKGGGGASPTATPTILPTATPTMLPTADTDGHVTRPTTTPSPLTQQQGMMGGSAASTSSEQHVSGRTLPPTPTIHPTAPQLDRRNVPGRGQGSKRRTLPPTPGKIAVADTIDFDDHPELPE
jgi:hypothetical protein